MDALVSDVAEAISPFLDLPFVFFGHSLGALVSFELAHRLSEEFGATPGHLFVSGCRGPHLPRIGSDIHQLPEEQFVAELRDLNGTPREVLENPDLIRTMMTTLRADFKLAETYICSVKSPLSCPITVFGGSEDSLVPQEALEAWKAHTTNSCNLWVLPGDHFFLHTGESLLLQILTQDIRRVLNRGVPQNFF
jgi:medium-chain acyl-[acyl-carrier-protein] hydrolase